MPEPSKRIGPNAVTVNGPGECHGYIPAERAADTDEAPDELRSRAQIRVQV